MARFHARAEGNVPFTAEEELEADLAEAQFIATQLDRDKADKIQTIKETTNLSVPVVVNGVTYNGGESSASAINGAYQLALLNQEPNVQLWDINNSVATYSLIQAEAISKAIAIDYRTKALARQARIMAVNAIAIYPQGTYPDYASAKAALDLV